MFPCAVQYILVAYFFCFCFVFFLTFVLLIYFLTSYLWLFSLLRHPVCGWVLSSPCLLTRLSGSSDSWPRNKSRIVPFLNGFEWKLAIKSGTTPREDIGEEPSWVYKKQAGSIRSLTCVAHMLRPLFYAAKSQWEHHYCNAWLLMLFPHYQSETQ